jgi:hypothetical protein
MASYVELLVVGSGEMDFPHLYVVLMSPDMDIGREAMSRKEVIPSANKRAGSFLTREEDKNHGR